jgi:ribonuclease T1
MSSVHKIAAALLCGIIALALLAATNLAGVRDARGELIKNAMPLIAVATLPPDGQTTLQLIKKGGPFPYRKDGSIFGNRERILPRQTRGYYKEYTVKTPGAHNRGARRIIAGEVGEYYYTSDHYNTFQRVVE